MSRNTWCRHRTPFDKEKHPVCKVGVDYHQFDQRHSNMPCLGQSAEARAGCPQYSGYTPEEIAKHEADMKAGFERIGTIRQAIVANVKATGQRQGYIPCPACKTGTVGYSQASNGHIHAGCSTPGCARWME